MAVLPTTKRISKEDIKDAPSWFDPFLTQINTFFSAVYDALNGQVTFVDNITAQVKDLTFTTLATYSSDDWQSFSFKSSLRKKATGLLILDLTQEAESYTPVKQAVSLDWTELNGNIVIGFVSGLENETTYHLRVLLF